jgi:hypothetical protein
MWCTYVCVYGIYNKSCLRTCARERGVGVDVLASEVAGTDVVSII